MHQVTFSEDRGIQLLDPQYGSVVRRPTLYYKDLVGCGDEDYLAYSHSCSINGPDEDCKTKSDLVFSASSTTLKGYDMTVGQASNGLISVGYSVAILSRLIVELHYGVAITPGLLKFISATDGTWEMRYPSRAVLTGSRNRKTLSILEFNRYPDEIDCGSPLWRTCSATMQVFGWNGCTPFLIWSYALMVRWNLSKYVNLYYPGPWTLNLLDFGFA